MWNKYVTKTPHYSLALRNTWLKHRVRFVTIDPTTTIVREDEHPSGMIAREKQYRATITHDVDAPGETFVSLCRQEFVDSEYRGHHQSRCGSCKRIRANMDAAAESAAQRARVVDEMVAGQAELDTPAIIIHGDVIPAHPKLDPGSIAELKERIGNIAVEALSLAEAAEAAAKSLDVIDEFADELSGLKIKYHNAIDGLADIVASLKRAE